MARRREHDEAGTSKQYSMGTSDRSQLAGAKDCAGNAEGTRRGNPPAAKGGCFDWNGLVKIIFLLSMKED
ncbi:hypothetical protein KSP40_PGU000384 [Platanthera guangdongensis]|uniref:Uncharacterized protein n=1 Tax=Platanthera guangdongensis TaxID=2320717 RepID=A0ABR2LQ70_9ASPA